MRFRYLSALVLLSLLLFSNTQGQGSFQNLGFESGIIVPVPGDPFGRIEFAPALPGWSGYVGNQTQTVVFYNNLFLGSPGIGLVGTNFGVINGQYSLVLQGGSAPGSPDVSISQSGMIPNGTRSLRFKAYDLPSIFKASLNGQSIDLLRLSDVDHIITYGGDISGFSGQNAELDLTAASGLPGSGNLWLDSISFSTQPVPEPSVLCLSSFALLIFGCWHLRKKLKKRRLHVSFAWPASSTGRLHNQRSESGSESARWLGS